MPLLSLLTTLNYSPETIECQGFSMVCAEKPCIFLSFLWINEPFLFLGTNCLLITLLQSAKIFIANRPFIHRDMHIIHRQRRYFHKSFYPFPSLYKEKYFFRLTARRSCHFPCVRLPSLFIFYPQYVNKNVDKMHANYTHVHEIC